MSGFNFLILPFLTFLTFLALCMRYKQIIINKHLTHLKPVTYHLFTFLSRANLVSKASPYIPLFYFLILGSLNFIWHLTNWSNTFYHYISSHVMTFNTQNYIN